MRLRAVMMILVCCSLPGQPPPIRQRERGTRQLMFALKFIAAIVCLAPLPAQVAFEVASVRPSAPGSGMMAIRIAPGGRLTAIGTTIRPLIMKAYGVRDFQIQGATDWMYSQRFDISAKPDGDVADDKVLLMLQSLLADRFHLKIHRETKETQVYLLTVGKNGPKLTAADPVENGGVRIRGIGHLAGVSATTLQLAEGLSDIALNGRHFLDRPVLDRTGLAGVYNFSLEWTPEGAPDSFGPSIFTATQDQLGLKLETQRAPVDILVIDRLEKPTEN